MYHTVFLCVETTQDVGTANRSKKLCQLVFIKHKCRKKLCLYSALLLVKMKNSVRSDAVYLLNKTSFDCYQSLITRQKDPPTSKMWDDFKKICKNCFLASLLLKLIKCWPWKLQRKIQRTVKSNCTKPLPGWIKINLTKRLNYWSMTLLYKYVFPTH